MGTELWNKIAEFDFDNPMSEYSFSLRLAKENFWTQEFTASAIVEYKKFMFLAATSEFMLSPSEIIDTVWHQHLIYTQSYTDFCKLIGKNIQHIPSTHSRADYERFKLAKERTKLLYETEFGEQPKDIWEFRGMYESLNLTKAKYKIRSIIIAGILSVFLFTVPAFLLLKPLYVHINNPEFGIIFVSVSLVTLALLYIYSKLKLEEIINQSSPGSFIYKLNQNEMIYFNTRSIVNIIHIHTNRLVKNNKVEIIDKKILKIIPSQKPDNLEEFAIMEMINKVENADYGLMLNTLKEKPVFSNVENMVNAYLKFITKSAKFSKLFYTNFGILLFVFLLGVTRIITGVDRGLPVTNITLFVILFIVFSIIYLVVLCFLLPLNAIDDLYKEKLIKNTIGYNHPDWQFYLHGRLLFATSFLYMVNGIERGSSGGGSSCTSGDGGSCGGCGGSCGGCGGGD